MGFSGVRGKVCAGPARREDQTLKAELPGYLEYAHRLRYKLNPGVWQLLRFGLALVKRVNKPRQSHSEGRQLARG